MVNCSCLASSAHPGGLVPAAHADTRAACQAFPPLFLALQAKEGFYALLDESAELRGAPGRPKFSRARDLLELEPRWQVRRAVLRGCTAETHCICAACLCARPAGAGPPRARGRQAAPVPAADAQLHNLPAVLAALRHVFGGDICNLAPRQLMLADITVPALLRPRPPATVAAETVAAAALPGGAAGRRDPKCMATAALHPCPPCSSWRASRCPLAGCQTPPALAAPPALC